MIRANYHRYFLRFKTPGGTSRGVLTQKETFFITIQENGNWGIGECALFRGLSAEDHPGFEEKLTWVCNHIHFGLSALLAETTTYPSIQFGLEQAFRSLKAPHPFLLFDNDFSLNQKEIYINGLIWMGSKKSMHQQIKAKLKEGYRCIKMKIGAIDFDTELDLLEGIRNQYNPNELELRVDANGAFTPDEVQEKLERLANLRVHSIEQPLKPNQWEAMGHLCKTSPVPIALDEELIGVFDLVKKRKLLESILPKYIILKPSLLGGYEACEAWIRLAEELNIGWWVTSALESNIGLNAIAQWTYGLQNTLPQGLGTGSLFTNNIDSPLAIENASLVYKKGVIWDENKIKMICI